MIRRRFFCISVIFGVVLFFQPVLSATSDVQINEIMYDPAGSDTDHEWVELYNAGSEVMQIIGGSGTGSWRLTDSSNHTFTTSTSLVPGGYLVVAQDEAIFLTAHPGFAGQVIKSSFSLTNTSGTVALRIGTSGAKWSEISYANSLGGAGDGKSLEKKDGGWQESAGDGGTPGLANSVVSNNPTPVVVSDPVPSAVFTTSTVESENNPQNSGIFQAHEVIINEFLSDPNTNEKEWVELYNNSDRQIDLADWWLEEGSEEETKLVGTILPRGYFIVQAPKGNLNNTGDLIALYDNFGRLRDQTIYGKWGTGNQTDNAPVAYDAKSIGRLDVAQNFNSGKLDFAVTARPTPGTSNVFDQSAREVVDIAEDSQPTESYFGPTSVILSELLPNPAGSDNEKEFIELQNTGTQEISLKGWKLKNSAKKVFTLATSTIPVNGFLTVWRKESKIALKNTNGDSMELLDPTGQVIDKVVYEDTAEENFSFNRIFSSSTVWQWSSTATPNQKNVLIAPNYSPEVYLVLPNVVAVGEEAAFDASDSYDPDDDELSFIWETEGVRAEGDNFIHIFITPGRKQILLAVDDGHGHRVEKKAAITIDKAPLTIDTDDTATDGETTVVKTSTKKTTSKSREILTVKGVVTVPPGAFASQTFYIFDPETQIGWPVYMYKKDFPPLAVGDLITAKGEAGSYQGGQRLKIKSKDDIDILATEQILEPMVVVTDELDVENAGAFIIIEGEVTDVGSGYFYLTDEQGEIKVQLKSRAGVKNGAVKEKDLVKVAGIVGLSKNLPVLWPRQLSDISITNPGDKKTETGNSTAKYASVTAGGLSSLFLALFARSRGLISLGFISKVAFWRKKKGDEDGMLG